MAGDWIKMRTDLYRDPKVCLIAEHLHAIDSPLEGHVNQMCQRSLTVTRNVLRNATVGALVTLWGVTRHRGKRYADDLLLRGATLSVLDDIADLPGIGDAMAAVGWAVENDEGVVLPRFFEEYNVEPCEDQKAKNAERQRRYREKHNALRNVTVASRSNDREEKRREEKKINTHTRESREAQNYQFPKCWSDRCQVQWEVWQASRALNHHAELDAVAWDAVQMQRSEWTERQWFDALVHSTGRGVKHIAHPEEHRQPSKGNGHAKPADDMKPLLDKDGNLIR